MEGTWSAEAQTELKELRATQGCPGERPLAAVVTDTRKWRTASSFSLSFWGSERELSCNVPADADEELQQQGLHGPGNGQCVLWGQKEAALRPAGGAVLEEASSVPLLAAVNTSMLLGCAAMGWSSPRTPKLANQPPSAAHGDAFSTFPIFTRYRP